VEEAIEQTKAAVKAACPKGVTAELKVLSAGAPSLTNPDNPFIHASAEAMKQISARKRCTSLRRVDSHRRSFRPLPGRPQRHDGVRAAGRQPARAQREVPLAELLPGDRSHGAGTWRFWGIKSCGRGEMFCDWRWLCPPGRAEALSGAGRAVARAVKITSVKALQLDILTDACLIKIETDAGITGYGESGVDSKMARARIPRLRLEGATRWPSSAISSR